MKYYLLIKTFIIQGALLSLRMQRNSTTIYHMKGVNEMICYNRIPHPDAGSWMNAMCLHFVNSKLKLILFSSATIKTIPQLSIYDEQWNLFTVWILSLLLFCILTIHFSFHIRCWDTYEIDAIGYLEDSSYFFLFVMNYEAVQCSFFLSFHFIFAAKVLCGTNRVLNQHAFIVFEKIAAFSLL